MAELTLWTIQHPGAWEQAQQSGVLRGDGRRTYNFMRPAYRWLMGEMRQRLAGYNGGYPVWAYPDHKPDLRRRQFSKGIPGVRIGFVADAGEYLISDMGAWHTVLNGTYCSLNEKDDIEFNAANEFFSVWRHSSRDPDRAAAIVDSWQRIFEPETLAASAEWWGPVSLQATLGQISLERVVDVRPFTSR